MCTERSSRHEASVVVVVVAMMTAVVVMVAVTVWHLAKTPVQQPPISGGSQYHSQRASQRPTLSERDFDLGRNCSAGWVAGWVSLPLGLLPNAASFASPD